jgi:hypothetical protein
VLRDVLPTYGKGKAIPKGDDWTELVEAAKLRAARDHVPYDSTSIDRAIHAAYARRRKARGNGAHA